MRNKYRDNSEKAFTYTIQMKKYKTEEMKREHASALKFLLFMFFFCMILMALPFALSQGM